MSEWEAIVRWYLVVTAASVAFYPLVAILGAGLGPAKVGLARPLGVVLLTALVWWPSAALGAPFNAWTLWAALIVSAAALWAWWLRRPRETLSVPVILAVEVLWLAAFLGYAWFRSYYPDIINTEKPMEIALLSSIVRSSEVPAPDPWLSGATINYYYFGYQVFGSIIKLSAVQAAVGFNLALATVFASSMTAVGAAGAGLARGIGARARHATVVAGVAVLLVVLAGNLETPRRLLSDTSGTIEAGWWDGVGWQASRIIADHNVHDAGDTRATINEFPAFSFVLGDLHPHVMTYPLLATVLGLAISFALSRRGVSYLVALASGSLVGLLYASNSWDAPLGFALLAGGLAISGWRDRRRTMVSLGLLILGAFVTVLPFLTHYTAPVGVLNSELPRWLTGLPIVGPLANTFGFVYWRPSSARELLIVHGLWIAAFAVFAGLEMRRDRSVLELIVARRHAALVAALLLVGAGVAWMPALILISVPLVLAAWMAYRATGNGTRALASLYAAGFLLVLIPEFFFLQDVFLDRMNTVFKFYFQAWMLLAVASAVSTMEAARRCRGAVRLAVSAGGVAALLLSLTYTPLSAWDWSSGFKTRHGLDGSAYLSRTAPGVLDAVIWVRANADDGEWLVEAPGCSYIVVEGSPMSSVSAFSGVPATIGWYGHEGQWRRGEERDIYAVLNERMRAANAILDGGVPPTPDGPSFVVLGRQERFGSSSCDRVTERPADVELRMIVSGWVVGFSSEQSIVFVPPWHASMQLER